ncbi:hypothetical protein FDC35_15900 [Clostridium botulinum]|nr:hypothetical protein [Clostridium botulinum]NFP02319.1 hypothetical protein [Clostridium botulinum]
MSILTNKLPVEVNIDGVLYKINSDYRTSIIFSKLIEDNEITEDIIVKVLKLYYPVMPKDIEQAINIIFWFYTCGENQEESNSKSTISNKKVFDYEQDSRYIYSAFLSQYKIDLQDIKYLHWWKFKALFEALDDNNEIIKIMQYRSMDLSKIKDKEQRNFYKKMQDTYKLKEKISEEDLQALNDIKNLLFK